jgi:multiple sugar transport system substrate-binding protein
MTRASSYLATAVTAILAVTLTACSSGGGGSADKGEQKISVWFPGTNQTEIDLVQKTIVPKFEKDTGAIVEVTFVDWNDLSTKLNAAFAAGSAPDVFGHGPAAVADFVLNQRLEALDDDVAKLPESDRTDLAAALPGGQVDGKQYLIPLSMNGSLIAYNGADFKAAGLDPDAPPRSWEDLRVAAEKLTKRDGSGKITRSGLLIPSQAIARQQSFASLLLSAGGQQLTPDNKKAAFNSPQGVAALTFYAGLYDGPQAVSANLGSDYSNAPVAQQPLVLGTTSMSLHSSNTILQMIKAKPDLDIRVMSPLTLGGNTEGHFLGGPGPGLMINADSDHKDLSWSFIKYMISADTSAEHTAGIGAVPPRASAINTPYVKDSKVLTTFVKSGPDFTPNPNVAGWVQARDVIDKYVELALNKKLAPQDALNQAAAEVDKILEANG